MSKTPATDSTRADTGPVPGPITPSPAAASPVTASPVTASKLPSAAAVNGSPQVPSAAEPTARFLLVRTGCTEYDQQRRIKGRIDIPLSDEGTEQVAQASADTTDVEIVAVYASPCQASLQTAEQIASKTGAKVKSVTELQNLDHGLWEGKLIEEVKSKQPKVYRRWQENPETVCPPEGEMLDDARRRLKVVMTKALKKHKSGVIAFVLPEPLATVFSCQIQGQELGDLWHAEKNSGKWELMDYHKDADD